MDIDTIRDICTTLPNVTEDIKWGNDLCFSIAGKMFCVAALGTPLKVSVKVTDEEFGDLSNHPGIIPAPYVARYKWIFVEDINVFDQKKWAFYIGQSYQLVKAKIPKRELDKLS